MLGVGGAVPGVDCALVGETVEDTKGKGAPAQNLWLQSMSAVSPRFFAFRSCIGGIVSNAGCAECWEQRHPYIHTRASHCSAFLFEGGEDRYLVDCVRLGGWDESEKECDDWWGGWRAVVVVVVLVGLYRLDTYATAGWPGSSVFAIGKLAPGDGEEG